VIIANVKHTPKLTILETLMENEDQTNFLCKQLKNVAKYVEMF
jgi:hypothetical protein